jgi:hypothetical protein
MKNMNDDFLIRRGSKDVMFYKGKEVLFVVNYNKTRFDPIGYFAYQNVRVAAIKSIYINENTSVIAKYIDPPDPRVDPIEIALWMGCVVFIETYPQ